MVAAEDLVAGDLAEEEGNFLSKLQLLLVSNFLSLRRIFIRLTPKNSVQRKIHHSAKVHVYRRGSSLFQELTVVDGLFLNIQFTSPYHHGAMHQGSRSFRSGFFLS